MILLGNGAAVGMTCPEVDQTRKEYRLEQVSQIRSRHVAIMPVARCGYKSKEELTG